MPTVLFTLLAAVLFPEPIHRDLFLSTYGQYFFFHLSANPTYPAVTSTLVMQLASLQISTPTVLFTSMATVLFLQDACRFLFWVLSMYFAYFFFVSLLILYTHSVISTLLVMQLASLRIPIPVLRVIFLSMYKQLFFRLSANSPYPAVISKICQISQFSVLTSAQNLSSFTKVLPSMQAYHRICQFSVLTNIQSFSCHVYHQLTAWFYSLDFATLIAWEPFYTLSILKALSRRCATQMWHLLNSRISIPQSSTTTLLPMNTSRDAYIGSGCSRIAWATVQPYAVSQPSTLDDQIFLSFVAYVEKENTESYPNDQFVHADIPLLILSKMLSLSIAKGIAASHLRWAHTAPLLN
jgi:hypothetical protein